MESLEKKGKVFSKRCLTWAAYSRFRFLRELAWRLIGPEGHVFSPPDSAVRLLVGGDVTFDRTVRSPRDGLGAHRLNARTTERSMLSEIRRKFWVILSKLFFSPRLFAAKIKISSFQELLAEHPENEKRLGSSHYQRRATGLNIDHSPGGSEFDYPFEKIAPLMKEKDLVLVNLETPLTSHPRARGHFMSNPRYAQSMKKAGISMVSLANNHIFDGGEIGFLHTLDHLKDAGISYTGAGDSLQNARLGELLQLNGMKLVFLSYTQFCNASFASVAAEYPGILPMDRELIVEDVKAAKKKADFVFVSLHWGFENQPNVHPTQVEIAHLLIDAGADGIIGHHPHVPHGIEVYRQRPILYSLGNFIFGDAAEAWSDNYLAEIVIDQQRVQGIIIYPISGQGRELLQPELLSGARADSLLNELQIKSATFNTGIAIQNHLGFVKIE